MERIIPKDAFNKIYYEIEEGFTYRDAGRKIIVKFGDDSVKEFISEVRKRTSKERNEKEKCSNILKLISEKFDLGDEDKLASGSFGDILRNKKGLCAELALAFHIACQSINLPCVTTEGVNVNFIKSRVVKETFSVQTLVHVFNITKIGGQKYFVDPFRYISLRKKYFLKFEDYYEPGSINEYAQAGGNYTQEKIEKLKAKNIHLKYFRNMS